MVSVLTSLGEWIHSPWFDLGLLVWKGYRPRMHLVLAEAMLLRGFRLFGVALHRGLLWASDSGVNTGHTAYQCCLPT